MMLRSGHDGQAVQEAGRLLREGRLVVFPTETVYGIGAHALDADAVRGIFAAKGRPADNPVIVHVAGVQQAQALAQGWPAAAQAAAQAFWPGPLTLVLPRQSHVPDATTGGLDTVALRVPAHPVAQALLAAARVPVAAPSANRSGSPSPTRVGDALEDIGGAAAMYLDAGPTQVGLESSVLDLSGPSPVLLRPGGVPRERLESVLGPIATASSGPVRSPGLKYRHYAPRTPLRLARPDELLALRAQDAEATAWLVSRESGLSGPGVTVVGSRDEPDAWAQRIFALLRDVDRAGSARRIVVETIPEAGLGEAVMDRLRRAEQG